MKTQEEINQFLNTQNLELDELSSAQSFKTNFLLINKNNSKFILFVNYLLGFIKNLYETININTIVNLVLNNLQTQKLVLNINSTLIIGDSINQTLNGQTYKITRISNINVSIECVTINDWNVDNLIIQVKTIDGTIIYPTINTNDNIINIYFNDIIGTNYNVIIL